MSDSQRAVDAWRTFRERITKRSTPTYDVYPDTKLEPEIKFYVEARDIRGRLLREYVDLEGYSVHHLNWKKDATRGGVRVTDWFAARMLEALIRLSARLEKAREEKERKEFNYDPRTGSR